MDLRGSFLLFFKKTEANENKPSICCNTNIPRGITRGNMNGMIKMGYTGIYIRERKIKVG